MNTETKALLIVKLNSYGFSTNSFNLLNGCLSGRKQRTKIGDNFSSSPEIVHEVPRGSILGPLLFNIYIKDLFLFSKVFNVANYADDFRPHLNLVAPLMMSSKN